MLRFLYKYSEYLIAVGFFILLFRSSLLWLCATTALLLLAALLVQLRLNLLSARRQVSQRLLDCYRIHPLFEDPPRDCHNLSMFSMYTQGVSKKFDGFYLRFFMLAPRSELLDLAAMAYSNELHDMETRCNLLLDKTIELYKGIQEMLDKKSFLWYTSRNRILSGYYDVRIGG